MAQGRVVTVTAIELAPRPQDATRQLGDGTAAMFLHWWLATEFIAEVLPGQYRLTDKGRRIASGLLNVEAVSA